VAYIVALFILKGVINIADIYVSTLDRKRVYQFPTLPEEFPTISNSTKNEEFATFSNGDFNLQNGVGLKEFGMGFMLAMHEYNFCKCSWFNSVGIINLLLTSMIEKFPIRFIFKGNSDEDCVNITVTCEKFDYNFDHQLDIVFSADFKEYRAIV